MSKHPRAALSSRGAGRISTGLHGDVAARQMEATGGERNEGQWLQRSPRDRLISWARFGDRTGLVCVCVFANTPFQASKGLCLASHLVGGSVDGIFLAPLLLQFEEMMCEKKFKIRSCHRRCVAQLGSAAHRHLHLASEGAIPVCQQLDLAPLQAVSLWRSQSHTSELYRCELPKSW